MEPDQLVGRFLVGVMYGVIQSTGFQAYILYVCRSDLFEKQSFLSIIRYPMGSRPVLTNWNLDSNADFPCILSFV